MKPEQTAEEAVKAAKAITANLSIPSEVELTCMTDIEMKKITWLWPDRIACGKLTVLAGDPGLGKSQLTAMLAAIITTGAAWPDGSDAPAIGDVVFMSAEDDPADTIKPRLVAAGADLSRCHVLSAVRIKTYDGADTARGFDLTKDVERLGEAIAKVGNVRLAVIDPISAYLGGTDSHNNADMRGLLMPLARMAEEHGVAIILVTHLNKSEHQDMIARVMGSTGLIAAARAGFVVVKDKEKPEIRYFLPIKNNIGNDYDGLAFHIEGVELPEGIKTSKVCWHNELVDAHKILHPEQEEKPTATNGAADFLGNLLADKPMMANEVFLEAGGAGYSKPSIQRAAQRMRIKRKKLGMGGGWEWSLNSTQAEEHEDGEDSIILSASPSEEEMQSS
jgi:energy-coupling factor transporter ATP-binding protein EcfA2